MDRSGPLPLTFEGPEQGFVGVKTAKMCVGESLALSRKGNRDNLEIIFSYLSLKTYVVTSH